MLKENRVLTYLDLTKNRIAGKGGTALAKGLQKNQALKTLILFGATPLAGVLYGRRSRGARAGGGGGIAAARNAAARLHCSSLRVSHHHDLSPCVAITSRLASQSPGNSVSAAGAKALANMMQANPRLTELDLQLNGIQDEGAMALAAALKNPQACLKTLLCRGESESPAAACRLLSRVAASFGLYAYVIDSSCLRYPIRRPVILSS